MPVQTAMPPLFTIAEYEAMVDRGELGPGDRVELLEGVIVEVSPQNEPDAAGVQRATKLLFRAISDEAEVRCQLPFRALPRSMPEPDIAVVPGPIGPHPSTALLIVEVSDTSIKVDRMSKSRIYAGAGIPELWIVDVARRVLLVHRDADVVGRTYSSVEELAGGTIQLLALPGVTVDVDALLGLS